MKKITMAILAVASGMLAACNLEKPVLPVQTGDTFRAVIAETKTSLVEDGDVYHVNWTLGDEIALTDGSGTAIYEAVNVSGGTAEFVRKSGVQLSGMLTAYYPASIVNNRLPVKQKYVAGNIAESPMVGEVNLENHTITFKNICGIVKLNLTTSFSGVQLKNLTLKANEGMSGEFTVNADGAAAVSGATGLIMDTEDTPLGADPVAFWFAVPAGTYSGFSVMAMTADGRSQKLTLKAGNTLSVERAKVSEGTLAFNDFNDPVAGKALLPSGQDFITYIKRLTDPTAEYNTPNTGIRRIMFSVNDRSEEGERIDDLESEVPIYARFDPVSGVVTINTAAAEICTGEQASYMFCYLMALEGIDNLDALNTSAATTMFSMFNTYNSDTLLTKQICLKELDLSSFNTENVTNMTNMFNNCIALEKLDLSSFNTSNVTTMRFMFSRCESLKELDLSNFDTGNVEDMGYMFNRCYELTSLNTSSFDTGNVINMEYMFYYLEKMTSLDVSHFNVEYVENLNYTFAYMLELESLDLSAWDTYNASTMVGLFRYQLARTSLNLGGLFTTENCADMSYWFYANDSMTEFDAELETGSCTDFRYFFAFADVLHRINLSTFDISNAATSATLSYMFYNLPYLDELILGPDFIAPGVKPTNFFLTSSHGPGDRTSSIPGYLNITCTQATADWICQTLLRYMHFGYYGGAADGCPRIDIQFKDIDNGMPLSVEWKL